MRAISAMADDAELEQIIRIFLLFLVCLFEGGKVVEPASEKTNSKDHEASLLHRIRQVEELNELLMQRLRYHNCSSSCCSIYSI